MTRDLRSVLEDLADEEGTVMARTAPRADVEAQHVRARARRRRLVRVGAATTGAAAASVIVAVLVAQGVTGTAPVLVGTPPATSTQATPRPEPTPTPTPTPTPPTVAPPTPSTWPAAVGEEEVMYGESTGPWWAVWVVQLTTADQASAIRDDPAFGELRDLGYAPSGTPVRCVVGSHEALGLDPATDPWGWPIYFGTAEDAEAFASSWGRPVVGVVEGASLACDWG